MDSELIFQKIKTLLTQNTIPSHDVVFDIMNKASEVLEGEFTSYRPQNDFNEPGSLIDFQSESKPVIAVPDLHARPDFLLNILEYHLSQFNGITVYQALADNKVRLVFVGDILHTEKTRERWEAVEQEFKRQIFTGPSISAEMQEGLTLLCGLYELKNNFSENVHILKGNHENILNQTANGDYCFKKYASEGHMCKVFLQEYYGDDIVYIIHCVEQTLPLVYADRNVVISHAEPATAYSRSQIINARYEEKIIEGLTWTANDKAEEGSVVKIIEALRFEKSLPVEDYVYLAGHRPVAEKYKLRQKGTFVQFHNPSMQNVAVIFTDKKFDPEKDIVEVKK